MDGIAGGRVGRRIGGWAGRLVGWWMDGRTDRSLYGPKYGWIYGWMYGVVQYNGRLWLAFNIFLIKLGAHLSVGKAVRAVAAV